MRKKQSNVIIDPKNDLVERKVNKYFLPFSQQIEKLLKISLLLLLIMLFLVQAFLLSSEEHQAMLSKVVRYEGVFQEDRIEIRATLQRN